MSKPLATTWRVLDGLPAYGAMATPFSATGRGAHSEGLVVEFAGPPRWVGNFQRGITSLDVVFGSREHSRVTVIAGGQGYVVEPESRRCVRTFGGGIEHAFFFGSRVVLSDGFTFEATDGDRLIWRTRRVSWDGVIGVRVDGERIVGEAYDPMTDVWRAFSVDVESGDVVGGSEPPDVSR